MTVQVSPDRSRLVKFGHPLEWILSALGALNCLIVPAMFTYSQFSQPGTYLADFWPFPAIYFIEIALFGLGCLISVAKNNPDRGSAWNYLPWISAGGLLAFVILGAWTIGFFLIPALLFLIGVGIISDRRKKDNLALHFIIFIGSAMVQSIIVFFVLFME
ncbi:MAG: hypothetical protein A2Z49_07130 [Chloroflexi bacterium RBG_19FT_COMBO_56_12]|nr:MAG: hypothetical protein A2Z49_07130 [Chloroflexi bacterium RBG_19FT_COMBO_56_12]